MTDRTELRATTAVDKTADRKDTLPDSLGGAWDRGADFVARHPGMSAEYVRAANPFRSSELAHMREARDNARAEVERLTALIDAVRELHAPETWWQWDDDSAGYAYDTAAEAADDSGCDCPYAPEPSDDLAHTAECLARLTSFTICTECARIEYSDAERQGGEFSVDAKAHYPCPTIRALDAGGVS